MYFKQVLGAAIVLALTACGSGGNNAASTAASAAASAAAAAPSAAASMAAQAGNAMASAGNSMANAAAGAMGVAAPIPAGLNCGAVKPVWVNTKSHAYHEPSDPMYGKTKNGMYMCPSAAKAAGDHPAGGHMMGGHHHHKGADNDAAAPAAQPT